MKSFLLAASLFATTVVFAQEQKNIIQINTSIDKISCKQDALERYAVSARASTSLIYNKFLSMR